MLRTVIVSCQVSSVEWFISVAAGLVPAFSQCRDAINRVSNYMRQIKVDATVVWKWGIIFIHPRANASKFNTYKCGITVSNKHPACAACNLQRRRGVIA